jgi:hypothetical protein
MFYLFEFCLKNMWNCSLTQQMLSHSFYVVGRSLVFFLLAIVLSVLLRYTDYSDYLFGIFQLFFLLIKTKEFDVLFSVTLNNMLKNAVVSCRPRTCVLCPS